MLSAVSDFSGLDGIMEAAKEEAPVVTRFSHVPEFPELLPEVRAELEEIQASMDAARAERESGKKPAAVSDSVSDEVDRIVSLPVSESADAPVPFAAAPIPPPPADGKREGPNSVPSRLPEEEGFAPLPNATANSVRSAQMNDLKNRIFEILSSDDEFPAFHVKAILDLCGEIRIGTAESELADIGSLLLYLTETLGVFFNRDAHWEDHKDSYVSSAVRSSKSKFRLKAIRLLSSAEGAKNPEDPEITALAKASFDRDYDRWRQKFSSLMKRNGGRSVTAFRTDFSIRPYGRSAEKCLEAGYALWKEIFLENRRIQADLTKIRGNVLLRKIRRIEKEFDFSDIEREAELEAARRGTYRPKKRHKKNGGRSVADTVLESDWSA